MRPLAALSLVLAACQGAPSPELGVRHDEIVNGTVTTGDPQVPLVLLVDGEYVVGLCTGTLISPRVVMTAAHCVAPDSGATAWAVYFGANINATTDPSFLAQRNVTAHVQHPAWNPADIGAGNDVALLQIQDTGPVAPKPINRTPLTGREGQPIRLIGFGDTTGGAGDAGVKRQAATTLIDFDGRLVYFGESGGNTCQGDSGGPNLMTIGGTEVVVGITSFGDEGCNQYGAGTRVDVFQTFIDPWVEAHDSIGCGMDGGCASGCGGAVDPDCPCAADGMCTPACSVPGGDPDCPADCGPNNGCNLTCPTPDPDCASCGRDDVCRQGCANPDPDCPVGVGEPCHGGPDCLSGQCLPDPADTHVSFCTSQCNSDGSGCPEGMACSEYGGQFYCVWSGVAPGSVGWPCETSADCQSGRCEGFDDQFFCTGPCDDGYQCREGWTCSADEAICVPFVEEPEEEMKSGHHFCEVGGRGGTPGAWILLIFFSVAAIVRRRA